MKVELKWDTKDGREYEAKFRGEGGALTFFAKNLKQHKGPNKVVWCALCYDEGEHSGEPYRILR